ncbi:hypothetical protein DSLASN_10210 [Desulfoluna limicola]|uniref:Peptidase S74 domain-containing protein n=1 Tax=Desulfoluna limicola TaxID=2810562 RepID=A0ABN6EYL6_9BACT|nr:tail fiber domain-containing protein [Desulfoluna limicola]BCS95389.1 hypothetical protein DSLASN_10210 [Desulfoluna limicola]
MRLSGFKGKTSALAVIICLFFWLETATAGTGSSAEVRLQAQSVTVTSAIAGTTYLMLRIVTPSGTHAGDWQSEGAPIQWVLPDTAVNGTYHYEIRIGTTPIKSRSTATETTPAVREKVETGLFRVHNGSIVIIDPNAEETGMLEHLGTQAVSALAWVLDALASPAHADVVDQDDAIIVGSECIGFDCVNGESFDFDTLRLKENNLRIHFNDTSSTGSFPYNDWRIIINDTANGGANFFSVEDSTASRRLFTLEAGAPANSLFVSSSGNIGLGTALPLTPLHMVDGNTPTLRLEQNGAEGFSPYTWDLSGNETHFFLKNVKTNTTPLVVDAATGALGLGTPTPRAELEIQQTNENAEFLLTRKQVTAGAADTEIFAKLEATESAVRVGSVSNTPLQLTAGAQPYVTLTTTGYLGIGTDAPSEILHVAGSALISGNLELGSSRELKFNIAPLALEDATIALDTLEPVRYRYKSDPDEESLGFIAEDVPDLVATNSRKSVSPMDVVAVLARVVKEQQETLQKQQKAINALELRLKALER